MDEPGLLGRDEQLRVLREMLGRLPEAGGALVLQGGPGVGKTALLRAAADQARTAGRRILEVTGRGDDTPFSGLREVLRPLLGTADALPAGQSALLRSALENGSVPPSDTLKVALAAFNLIATAAAERPTVLIIDDVHRLDRPTRDVMAFIARRVGDNPFVVVGAIRGVRTRAVAPVVDVPVLNEPAAQGLLARHAATLPPAVRERILAEALGNPLALVEFPAAWRTTGLAGSWTHLPVSPALATAFATGPAGSWTHLPVSPALAKAFAAGLDELPARTRDALLVAAVDHVGDLAEILAAAAVLAGRGVAVDFLDRAAEASLIRLDRTTVRFCHPVVRFAVLAAETPARRRSANAVLAQVLAEHPARRTWHRAQSIDGPDDELADELADAHGSLLRRHGVVAAIRALERSAQLTTDSPTRGHRYLNAAEHAYDLGRTHLTHSLIEEAERQELRPADRAKAGWLRDITETDLKVASDLAPVSDLAPSSDPALAAASAPAMALGSAEESAPASDLAPAPGPAPDLGSARALASALGLTLGPASGSAPAVDLNLAPAPDMDLAPAPAPAPAPDQASASAPDPGLDPASAPPPRPDPARTPLPDITELSAGDPDLALDLLLSEAQRARRTDAHPVLRARVGVAAERLDGSGDPRHLAALALTGPVRYGRAVAEWLPSSESVWYLPDADALRLFGTAAHEIGDPVRAVDLLARAEPVLREQGRFGLLADTLLTEAADLLVLGDWPRATRLTEEARRILAGTCRPTALAALTGTDAIAAALRGQAHRVTEPDDSGAALRLCGLLPALRLARGISRLGEGRYVEAYEELRPLLDQPPENLRRTDFAAVMPFALAADRGGDRRDTARILAVLEEAADVTPAPLLHVQLPYARAVLAADAVAEELYLVALGQDLARWPLVRARTELAYGQWLRSRRQAARSRTLLLSARTTFEIVGASDWAGRTSAQGPDHALPSLTELLSPQEALIARLAAEGLSNREIAERVHLSHRTVAAHLYRTFPKLGITSRAELAPLLALSDPVASDD
ncbi:AAA family ATPase [Streptomyces sp. NPDC001002]